LPAPAPVSLKVYDLQGRCTGILLDDEAQAPGRHAVRVLTEGWPAGCYLYRLDVAGTTITRKMLVMK
jgi:hypothetical protein